MSDNCHHFFVYILLFFLNLIWFLLIVISPIFLSLHFMLSHQKHSSNTGKKETKKSYNQFHKNGFGFNFPPYWICFSSILFVLKLGIYPQECGCVCVCVSWYVTIEKQWKQNIIIIIKLESIESPPRKKFDYFLLCFVSQAKINLLCVG